MKLVDATPDLSVCGEAETAREALSVIERVKPDLVLLDLSLPEKSGLELLKDLRALHPHLPVLVLSMHDEAIFAERALRSGARGYIRKQEKGPQLLEAIRYVLSGHVYVSDQLVDRLFNSLSGRRPDGQQNPGMQITDRELEVLMLIGRARESRDIAQQLGLSLKTVETHRANIKRKLKLKTASELVRYAVLWTESTDHNCRL